MEYPIPSYGDIFTAQDFYENVKQGFFIDDDGTGYYSDGVVYYRNEKARPSEIRKNGIKEFSHIVWFNK